jgi:hypothetical protein
VKLLLTAALAVLTLGAAPETAPTVQPCTSVSAETMDAVDSAHAKAGDFFRFRTLQATTDGSKHIVIPSHTVGYGVVSIAIAAGKQGQSGSLLLEPLYLKMPDGSQLGVVLDHGSVELHPGGKSGELIPGYLGLVPLPGLGFAIGAINYFRHGKDITLPKGTPFAVFPENDPQSAFCQPG